MEGGQGARPSIVGFQYTGSGERRRGTKGGLVEGDEREGGVRVGKYEAAGQFGVYGGTVRGKKVGGERGSEAAGLAGANGLF